MIIHKHLDKVGHHTLLADITRVINLRLAEAPFGTSLVVGIKSASNTWDKVIPFMFSHGDGDAALASIEEHLPVIQGSRFLPACMHDCVVYFVDSDALDRLIDGQPLGSEVEDDIFPILIATMQRMQRESAPEVAAVAIRMGKISSSTSLPRG